MAEAGKPRRHATTRYQQVDEEVIDDLQQAHHTGGDLYQVAPWLSVKNKRVILAETLDADRLIDMPAQRLFSAAPDVGPMTDFKRAVLAEMTLESPRSATGPWEEPDREERAMVLLEEVARSETASPTLAYEPIYRDLAEAALLNDDPMAVDWLKRAAAHNLHHNKGNDILFNLIDLASAYLQLGHLDLGLTMLVRLLHHDPGNVWVYRFMATGFPVLGLTALGLRAARRGLTLLDEQGDPEELHDEFLMAQIELQTSPNKGRESQVSPEVLEAVEAALALDFDAGQPLSLEDLCRDLVPGWDEVPVKAPLRFEDLPPDVRAVVDKG